MSTTDTQPLRRSNGDLSARNRQRYTLIRLIAQAHGLRIKDLHDRFNSTESKSGRRPVSKQAFYAVCRGELTSERVRRFVSRSLRHNHQEIWT